MMGILNIFSRKETSDETYDRLLKLTNGKSYGVFMPPMDAQVAVRELCKHFLGDDWYSINPCSAEQINTEIVFEIERRYNVRRVKSR